MVVGSLYLSLFRTVKRDTFLTRKLIPRAFVSLFSVGEWATLRRRRRRRRDNVRNECETLDFLPALIHRGLAGGLCVCSSF